MRPAFPGVKNTQPRRVGCFRFKKETEDDQNTHSYLLSASAYLADPATCHSRPLMIRETLGAAIPYDKLQCCVEIGVLPLANMPADSHITTPDLGDIPFREWLRLSSVAYRVEGGTSDPRTQRRCPSHRIKRHPGIHQTMDWMWGCSESCIRRRMHLGHASAIHITIFENRLIHFIRFSPYNSTHRLKAPRIRNADLTSPYKRHELVPGLSHTTDKIEEGKPSISSNDMGIPGLELYPSISQVPLERSVDGRHD